MGKLCLALLGTPEIQHDGEMLTFPTRKTLALLVYLVVEQGLHSREKLTAFFWPESDVTRGRAPLRNTLGHLRTVLHEALEEHPAQEVVPHMHLIIARDTLGFDFTSDYDLDLSTLETASGLVRSSSAMQDATGILHGTMLTQIQQAMACYRGGFLEGFSLGDAPAFDNWFSVQCEVWHRRVSLLFDQLSRLQFERGELASAIDTTTRWVAHDTLSEIAYRRLMRVHFAAGNREVALRAYQTCRTALYEELRAQPTPETKGLAERIRTTAPRQHTAHELHASPPPSAVLEDSFPFVGRATEYATLVERYYRASQGHTQVVRLEGEAGIGKTRLVSEFLGWAAAQGADVVQGQAFEAGGRLPYQPLVEILRPRLERENAPDDLLSDTWLAELSRLLPELRDRYPNLPPPVVDEALARTRLFEAIVRLGQALANRAPLVLFIDDVHWADAASLDVLHYASRRWRESGSPLLLLMSLHSEALLTVPHLSEWISGVVREMNTHHLALEPLTLEATLQLVQSLAQEGPHDAQHPSPHMWHAQPSNFYGNQVEHRKHPIEHFGHWLFRETGGQPFFIVETLRVLLERGAVIPHRKEDGAWVLDLETAARDEAKLRGLLPPGVREVIRSRLAHLNPPAFGLLAAGAVLGQGFSFARLCQVAGLGENEGLSALDELLLSRLLRLSPSKGAQQSEVSYFFTHEKFREVVYTEVGEARRQIFHRRALEALQGVATPSAQLAHHALHARLSEPTFRFSLAAGDDAMRLFAWHDALVHYEQAKLVLAEWTNEQNQHREISVADVQHLYVQLGRAYELGTDYHQAHSVYEAMLTFARERHEPTIVCTALNRLATLAAWKSYDMEAAGALLQEALQVAESSGDKTGLAETEWNLAQMNFYTFQAQKARSHAERALILARELDLPELIARSLNVLAYANMRQGNLKEIVVYAEEARARYATIGNRAMEADCLTILAFAMIHIGLPLEGVQAARTSWAIGVEIENAWGQASSAIPLGLGLREIGAYTEALTFTQQSASIARLVGFSLNLMFGLFALDMVQGAILALNASRAALLEALAVNERIKSRPHGEALAGALCMNSTLIGEWKEAHAYALQALAARDYLCSYGWHLTLWYETAALLRGGDAKLAEEEVQRFSNKALGFRHRMHLHTLPPSYNPLLLQ